MGAEKVKEKMKKKVENVKFWLSSQNRCFFVLSTETADVVVDNVDKSVEKWKTAEKRSGFPWITFVDNVDNFFLPAGKLEKMSVELCKMPKKKNSWRKPWMVLQ